MRLVRLVPIMLAPWFGLGAQDASCAGDAPSARSGHVMAFDAARRVIVLFGGFVPESPTPFARTMWSWDGARWRCIAANGPAGRIDAHLAWDAARERLVLFGGRQITRDRRSIFLRDTWEWDGSTWTLVDTAGPGPRVHGAMAYDPSRRAIVVHGGGSADAMLTDTWEWRGGRWHELSIAVPPGSVGNALGALGEGFALMIAVRDTSPNCVGRRRAELWILQGTALRARPSVGPCFSPQAPAVAAGDRLLLFAGWNAPQREVEAETWHFRGASWTKLSGGPSKRRGAAIAFDAVRGRAVLFGGEGEQGVLGDLWEHDGRQWIRAPQ